MPNQAFVISIDDDVVEELFAEAAILKTTPENLAGKWMRDVVDKRRDYDAWYLREIEAALREADDPDTEFVPHEVVMAESRAQRARFSARAKSFAA